MPHQTALLTYGGTTKLVKLKDSYDWGFGKGSRRGRYEIMAEILIFCDCQRAKTSIMYKINLNYTNLTNNLKFLMSQDLLMYQKGKYVTTEKGNRFLILFAQLTNMLSS
jgi:predicted transcriptional regulator